MLAGVIDYSIMLRMSNWMGETLATEVTFECSAESFEPALQPRLLCWATGLFFWHRRWTENHWNFSGPHADPLITMKVAWHQVDITLPWIHHRKPFLHCCFHESYINTYPSFFLFLMSLYRTVTVFHSLVLWVFHILSYVFVGFISISLKQGRNWLATGNSFQNNIAP